jgi:N-dimethylarginine dimethylaminohydrolase
LQRAATQRHFLMVRPTHFDVQYSINPWMDPAKPTSAELAITQWEWLCELYAELGHRVEQLDPVSGLPDMVFAANGATVLNGRALVARFRYPQRDRESQAYHEWFGSRGFGPVRQAQYLNEGQGDFLAAGPRLLAGCGFRSDRRSHAEAAAFFNVPVVGLTLVDARYYHLDTALAVLDPQTIMYYPQAFSARSQATLRELYPDAILASAADAAAFGLNAVSDGLNVVLPEAAAGLARQLRDRGYRPFGADVSELLKAGGGVKCCTLELQTC